MYCYHMTIVQVWLKNYTRNGSNVSIVYVDIPFLVLRCNLTLNEYDWIFTWCLEGLKSILYNSYLQFFL